MKDTNKRTILKKWALAHVTHWLQHQPAHQRFLGSILGQGYVLGLQVPSLGLDKVYAEEETFANQLNHKKLWNKLKCILLKERSQYEKLIYLIILITWHSEKGKLIKRIFLKKSVFAQSLVGATGRWRVK